MGATVFKQPNGLLGRYSHVSDGFTHCNMTPEEYIISTLDRQINDSKDVMKHHLGEYEKIMSDAREHLGFYDEWIKDAEDDDEIKDLQNQKKLESDDLEKIKKEMEEPFPESEVYKNFYKELLGVVENLAVLYDYEGWDMERKKYILVDHPYDMKVMTEKLKEVNELYNKLKDGQKD